ncbi:MAG: hypothetical protein ACO1OB_11170 [Archangium sp.]
MKRFAGFVLALSLVSCRCTNPEVQPVPDFIRVTPTQLDFGRVFVGGAASAAVEVVNAGKAPLEGTWSLSGVGFFSDDSIPSRAVVGSTLVTVRCVPPAAGVYDGVLTIALTGFDPVHVPLACEGVAPPECASPGVCRVATWSTELSRCVTTNAEDGLDCSNGDQCLVSASCRTGRCEGQLRECADEDPCTADTCNPQRGCEHTASVKCADETPCRVGRCVAGVGCELVDAADGTPCGPNRSCTMAEVCISGVCEVRDPPDGFQCAAGGPCGGDGRCVNDACVQDTVATVTPSWTAGALVWDGGVDELWSDVYAQRDGGLSLSSYFLSPTKLSADSAAPVQLTQSSRRCLAWNGWDVCGDLPATADSPIAALDSRTGIQQWSYGNGRVDITEFARPRTEFFTGRLAVLNENELLVLYESRTFDEMGVDPRCREYGMVVLDRLGQPLRSLFINDPIFTTCNHPHSYGVAVDAQSNIYLAFSPSSADNPAISLPGTTIFSFSPALQLRWRRHFAGLSGGDLAVGSGLLFHENHFEVLSTTNGATVATLPSNFGPGVIGSGVATFPDPGSLTLRSLLTSSLLPGWSRTFSGGQTRAPLVVASWDSPWGPRDVAINFTSRAGRFHIEATELATGAAAFECPVAITEEPLMTTLVPGGIAVMLGGNAAYAGWSRCDACDPKYARTRNAFALLPLPGLSPSSAPWSGGWGNEGHTHREGR